MIGELTLALELLLKVAGIVGAKTDGKIGKENHSSSKPVYPRKWEDALAFNILNSRLNHYTELVTSAPKSMGNTNRVGLTE